MLLSHQINANRKQTVRFTLVGLSKIHSFVDLHGEVTAMVLQNVVNILCHCTKIMLKDEALAWFNK